MKKLDIYINRQPKKVFFLLDNFVKYVKILIENSQNTLDHQNDQTITRKKVPKQQQKSIFA